MHYHHPKNVPIVVMCILICIREVWPKNTSHEPGYMYMNLSPAF